MGDFRVTIEAVGGHGCGRGTEYPLPTVTGEAPQAGGSLAARLGITRCRRLDCPDCAFEELIRQMKGRGVTVAKATLEHWPVPGAAGTTRTENPGPIDDLLNSTRDRAWR